MTNHTPDEECATKQPIGRIVWHGFKKGLAKAIPAFMEEGARSIGKVVLYVLAGVILLWIAGAALSSFTDFMGGWLDWVPNPFSWFGGSEAVEAVPVPTQPEAAPAEESTCTIWGRNVPAWATKCK